MLLVHPPHMGTELQSFLIVPIANTGLHNLWGGGGGGGRGKGRGGDGGEERCRRFEKQLMVRKRRPRNKSEIASENPSATNDRRKDLGECMIPWFSGKEKYRSFEHTYANVIMWQFWVENKHCFVAYFNCIIVF